MILDWFLCNFGIPDVGPTLSVLGSEISSSQFLTILVSKQSL